MPPLECGPAFYLLRAITALENAITFTLNVTTLGKDYCLIVNSFEKNYRERKSCSCFVKSVLRKTAVIVLVVTATYKISGILAIWPGSDKGILKGKNEN
jgi:hypothetical protein